MKRLILFALTAILIVLFNTMAEAKNGPHSGPTFVADTDVCAVCHRSHTGELAPLLGNDASTVFGFCTFCHGGAGANVNVVSGVFEGDENISYPTQSGADHNTISDGEPGKGLNSGGYAGAYTYTGRWSRSSNYVSYGATPDADGRRHNVAGADTNTFIAWGGGQTGPGQEISGFTCISCHDPHGTENADGTERYRSLKGGIGLSLDSKVNGKLTGALKSNEIAAFSKHDYTRDAYRIGIANFCIACHTQYKTAQGTIDQFGNEDPTGTYNSGDSQGSIIRHRHQIVSLGNLGNLPGIRGQGQSVWDNMNRFTIRLPIEQLAYSQNIKSSDYITCLTCHQSHGTAATMSPNSKTFPANSSTLLRMENRGVCEACHYK